MLLDIRHVSYLEQIIREVRLEHTGNIKNEIRETDYLLPFVNMCIFSTYTQLFNAASSDQSSSKPSQLNSSYSMIGKFHKTHA